MPEEENLPVEERLRLKNRLEKQNSSLRSQARCLDTIEVQQKGSKALERNIGDF
jgi:hypothetical protein